MGITYSENICIIGELMGLVPSSVPFCASQISGLKAKGLGRWLQTLIA